MRDLDNIYEIKDSNFIIADVPKKRLSFYQPIIYSLWCFMIKMFHFLFIIYKFKLEKSLSKFVFKMEKYIKYLGSIWFRFW